jgi:hypothetical protein
MKFWYMSLFLLPFAAASPSTEMERPFTPAQIERDIEVGMMTENEPQLESARLTLIDRVKQHPNFVEHLNAGIAEYLGNFFRTN